MRVRATVTVIGCAGAAVPASAATAAVTPALRVGGEVLAPATYSPAQLAALPQATYTVTDGGKKVADTGVLLQTLVDDAHPAYPASLKNTKNEFLRATVTVRSTSGYQVTFAYGELATNYGNHPALLALSSGGHPTAGGPELVVPGDRTTALFAHRVQLAALPQEARTVSFSGMSGPETRKEAGPPLLDVLAAARVPVRSDTWVAAVGSDNYAVTVTPGEQLVGGRTLMLSLVQDGTALAQPRLVPDGDFYGDRFDNGVVDLYVGTGPAR